MNILLRLILFICLSFIGQSYATTAAVAYGYEVNAFQAGVENLNNNGLTNPSGCCSKLSARDSQDRAQARAFFALTTGFDVPKGTGAESAINGARLNMQLTAEQAAGARMPTQITDYSEHAIQQMAGRDGGIGVNQAAVNDAWLNPTKIDYVPSKYGPTFRFTGKDAVVVVNTDGKVVTTWAKSSAGTGR